MCARLSVCVTELVCVCVDCSLCERFAVCCSCLTVPEVPTPGFVLSFTLSHTSASDVAHLTSLRCT